MRLGAVLGVIVTLGAGMYLYSWQMKQMASASGAASPRGIIDAVAVKSDLLAIAGAERQQFALEGHYLSLDELRAKGVKLPENQGRYSFSADVTPMDFTITATYDAPDGQPAPPPLSIGPSMVVQ